MVTSTGITTGTRTAVARVPSEGKEIFVPHAHDSADKVDSALEASLEGMLCLKISFAGLILTALVQTAIVYYTNSVAMLGDTLHNTPTR
jgi:hypothetical protein